jgi:hypothetical protein
MNIPEKDGRRKAASDYPVDAPDKDYEEKEKIWMTCF